MNSKPEMPAKVLLGDLTDTGTAYLNLKRHNLDVMTMANIMAAIVKTDSQYHPLFVDKVGAHLRLIYSSIAVRDKIMATGYNIGNIHVCLDLPLKEQTHKEIRINLYGIPLSEPVASVAQWLAAQYQVMGGHQFIKWMGTDICNSGRTFTIRVPKKTIVPGFCWYASETCSRKKIQVWHPGQGQWCRACFKKGHVAEQCRNEAQQTKTTNADATPAVSFSGLPGLKRKPSSPSSQRNKQRRSRQSSPSVSSVEGGRDGSVDSPRLLDTPLGQPDRVLHDNTSSPASTSGGASFSPITLPPEHSFDAGEIDGNPRAWTSVASSKRRKSWDKTKPDLVIRNKKHSLNELKKYVNKWRSGDKTEIKHGILKINNSIEIHEVAEDVYYIFGLTGDSYASCELRKLFENNFT